MAEETKEPRTVVEIQTEYAKVCGVAGDKQYRMKMIEHELDNLNQRMYSLNKEFEAAEAKVKADSPTVDAPAPEADGNVGPQA